MAAFSSLVFNGGGVLLFVLPCCPRQQIRPIGNSGNTFGEQVVCRTGSTSGPREFTRRNEMARGERERANRPRTIKDGVIYNQYEYANDSCEKIRSKLPYLRAKDSLKG